MRFAALNTSYSGSFMLRIYRSSRIEKLAELLAVRLHQLRPASVLAPQTLVVGHLGMKRWLMQFLADQRLLRVTPRILGTLLGLDLFFIRHADHLPP